MTFDLIIILSFFLLSILIYRNKSAESFIFLLISWLLIFCLLFFYGKNNFYFLYLALFLLPCLASILFLPKITNNVINYLYSKQHSYYIFVLSSILLLLILLASLLVFVVFSVEIRQEIFHNKQKYLMQIKENPLIENSHNIHLTVKKFYLKENLQINKKITDDSYLNTKKISQSTLYPFFLHHELLILAICLIIMLRTMPLALNN